MGSDLDCTFLGIFFGWVQKIESFCIFSILGSESETRKMTKIVKNGVVA